ncbi:failed axon connections-like [Centruroides sculpturatus]|uniref:failed axon connections-like n=1 Tax=Centruroides sculpturatus TaxID=218467 RepID=UPI000C6E087B|nr:failed axon connections-like [Centruroides sculpturatus]
MTTDTAVETPNETPAPAENNTNTGNNSETVKTPAPAPVAKPTVHKTDYEKDVVYLYQFNRSPTIPSISPFCLKVETWLRMTGLKYENVDHKMRFKSKKGQLPFVEINGREIADSDIIIKELAKMYDKDLNQDLTPDQRNISHAFISMLNNHTSWVVRWWRYSHPGQFLRISQMDVKRTFNSKMPKGIVNFFFRMSFKNNVKRAIGHGLGRHTAEEIYEFGKADLKALSDCLAEKPYFFGNEPHLLDCVAFANICQFYFVPFADIKDFMEGECSNLVSFVDRMKKAYWPDWDEMCKNLELNTHLPKKKEEKEKENEVEKEKDAEDKEKGGEEKESEKEKEKDTEKEKLNEKEDIEKDNKEETVEKETVEEKKD